MRKSAAVLSLVLTSFFGAAQGAPAKPSEKMPLCYGPDKWATQVALGHMVDAGLIRDSSSIYRGDTPYSLTTALLDSYKVGVFSGPEFPRSDVYRQIEKFTVKTKEGQLYEVMTITEATFVECSMAHLATVVLTPEFRVLQTGKSILKEKK